MHVLSPDPQTAVTLGCHYKLRPVGGALTALLCVVAAAVVVLDALGVAVALVLRVVLIATAAAAGQRPL